MDSHSRPVVLFDDNSQNTTDVAGQMRFMAWNFELAIKAMSIKDELKRKDNRESATRKALPSPSPPVTKWVLLIRLDAFSLLNSPSMSTTRETLNTMMNVYCERLGLIVAYDAPGYFNTVYNILKPLIDERTRSKIVVVPKGRCKVGSEADGKLRELLGEEWRGLCNVDLKYEKDEGGQVHSPGFDCVDAFRRAEVIERRWREEVEPGVLRRVREELDKREGGGGRGLRGSWSIGLGRLRIGRRRRERRGGRFGRYYLGLGAPSRRRKGRGRGAGLRGGVRTTEGGVMLVGLLKMTR